MGCFLCDPPKDLIVHSDDEFFCLAGLGPIGPAYLVAAPYTHDRSIADMETEKQSRFVKFMSGIRIVLRENFDECLITEHGRVPVCLDENETHDDHCYHAHALIFGGIGDVSELAKEHLADPKVFTSFLDLPKDDHYILISPHEDKINIFQITGALPRQFTRGLAAHSIGRLDLVDWRSDVTREAALRIADNVKGLLKKKYEPET